jgi:ubiquinone/menaquinone biosynthesis C-methylase UbiE
MADIDAYMQRLLDANPLREPLLRSVIEALTLPTGSRGLDAGCGVGLQTLLLAEAAGPQGHVTGLDIVPEFLAYGEDLAWKAGLSGRISFQEGDIYSLPFHDDSFDWVWSADCIGYPAGELAGILKELARVVRPGGSINLLAWTSQQVLPGYPLLEARLNASCSSYIPFLTGKDPQQHFLRALCWFQGAGLKEVRARTFVGEVQAPLSAGERTALVSLFEMLWEKPAPGDGQEDWAACQRLCRAESPDFILDLPYYYAFFTYTLFCGKVPAY